MLTGSSVLFVKTRLITQVEVEVEGEEEAVEAILHQQLVDHIQQSLQTYTHGKTLRAAIVSHGFYVKGFVYIERIVIFNKLLQKTVLYFIRNVLLITQISGCKMQLRKGIWKTTVILYHLKRLVDPFLLLENQVNASFVMELMQ